MVERTLSAGLHALEQLVANWPDAVLVFDSDAKRYLVANAAAERLSGYPRDELVRSNPTVLSHPDDAREIPAIIAQTEEGDAVRRPWRILCKDGAIVETEMTLTRCQIDGRWVSQAVFRRQEDSFQALTFPDGRRDNHLKMLEQTSVTVVALDRYGVITYWNAAATAWYGLEAHEAVGRPVLELAPTDEVRAEVESLMSHHQSRNEWVSKLTIRPQNATPFEALVTGSIIRADDGEFDGILFVTAPMEEIARAPEPRMRRAKVECAACGREVAGTMRRKYCSEKCRQWAYYHRHLDAQRARSRERHERRRTDASEATNGDSP